MNLASPGRFLFLAVLAVAFPLTLAASQPDVGRSPWGPDDQIGRGAMVVGADNLSFEAFPSELDGNYIPLHTYLLAQKGAFIIELAFLDELARDGVYEFAFIAGSLKFRGADAAPLRPVAFPVRPGH